MSIPSVSAKDNGSLKKSFSMHSNAIESTRKAIEKSNYSEAITYISMLCNNQSIDSRLIKEVYSLFNDLLTHINKEEFKSLQKAIQKLLDLSPEFPDLQKDLAIQLASMHVKKGDNSSENEFSFYLQAMHYYSKALKIVEKYNLTSDVHYLASQIFLKIIKVHNINSKRIKQQLKLAARKGNPKDFGRSLRDIETLNRYRMPDDNVIKTLYGQAGKVLNDINPSAQEHFNTFFDKIQSGLFGEFSPKQFITKCCLEAFYEFRNFLENEFNKISNPSNYEEVRVFQKKNYQQA